MIGEEIEGSPAGARGRADQPPVFPLIEEAPRLLSRLQCRDVAHVVFGDFHVVRHRTVRRNDFERQAFVPPHAGVVAQQDALGRQHLVERREDVGARRLQAGGQELNDEVRSVAVHDERRQAIAFAVDDAVRGGVNAVPSGRGRADGGGPP